MNDESSSPNSSFSPEALYSRLGGDAGAWLSHEMNRWLWLFKINESKKHDRQKNGGRRMDWSMKNALQRFYCPHSTAYIITFWPIDLRFGCVSPNAGWIDVKSSLAKSHNVRNHSPNNTPHASPRCAPGGLLFFCVWHLGRIPA
jgi:hypothetical protein